MKDLTNSRNCRPPWGAFGWPNLCKWLLTVQLHTGHLVRGLLRRDDRRFHPDGYFSALACVRPLLVFRLAQRRPRRRCACGRSRSRLKHNAHEAAPCPLRHFGGSALGHSTGGGKRRQSVGVGRERQCRAGPLLLSAQPARKQTPILIQAQCQPSLSYSGRSRAPATGVHSLSFESADAVASKGLLLSG